jgi:NAD+ diphosphatase
MDGMTTWPVRPDSPLDFLPSVERTHGSEVPTLWLAFRGSDLLVNTGSESPALPVAAGLSPAGLPPAAVQHLGTVDGMPCGSAEIPAGTEPPPGWEFVGLRSVWDSLGDGVFRLAGRALLVVDWDRNHRFCGRCATPTRVNPGERARECPSCGLVAYPRISPAVIVAVVRGDRLLLARAARFAPGQYSVLAGFADAGETLEECVVREVKEEVGIEITGLRYFGSQPWPFPNSLMLAFTAEHASGEIAIDGREIVDAGWYAADSLPRLPPRVSIARRLIEWFVATGGKPA